MSASTTLSELVSSEDWQLAEDGHKATSLLVQLRRGAFVLPWLRFLYAEGDNNMVKLAFASHMVTVSGDGLAALLAAVVAQRVLRLIQPTDKEARFAVRGVAAIKYTGPSIHDITIEQFQ